ncbi:hypothetical protein sscle_02g021630 [Sclerotinia sclerotiorum 1980 UF-70]|uniref:Thioredoxin domain-containing protein n=1 Tax=Sclerotinia sclerotiorum (strain ATCC 18683 / 1980 / Ss-1) TaxID=665079 RepID=A0A1D9PYL9_SCLS1|nr:hypothetical protein sscle_02g021630 [Sclerotinia sclerotiorum 1980 UF-70]
MLPLKRISYSFPKSSTPIAISISHSHSQIPSRYRHFASTPPNKGQNRICSPVRYPTDLSTYISLSTSTSKPLLTLWTTSSCSSCRTISPLLHEIIENGTGEKEGGVLYTEVEFDAPDLLREGLGIRYLVRSVPSLVVFWRGEVGGEGLGGIGGGGMEGGRERGRLNADEIQRLGREGLEEWVRGVARRGEEWRGMHPGGEGLFGGLFKGWGK